jgi:cell division protease FtsH
LKFDDLAGLAIRGADEFRQLAVKRSTDATRKKTAYHEAGHACISVIESQGRNIPDYCSIVPARDFAGIVMESLSYSESLEEFTFENLLLRTRVALAGRAAEEIYFGPSGISSGANSDLNNATRLSFHMFAHSGFHPLMGQGQGTAANLAVIGRGEVDELQNDRIQRAVRQFLETQYEHVVETLQKHRDFVDAVAERLLWDPVIDQLEMTEIANQFSLPTTSSSE